MLLCLSYALCMIEVFELHSIYICPMMKNSPVERCFCFLVFSLHLYCHTHHHQYAAVAVAAAASSSPSSSSFSSSLLLLLLLFFIGFGRGGSGWYSYCHKRCWMAFKENHKFHCRWIIIAMRSEGWSLVNFFPLKHFLLQVLVPEVLYVIRISFSLTLFYSLALVLYKLSDYDC